MVFLRYEISDRDIAKKYFNLSIFVPLSMTLVCLFISWKAQFSFVFVGLVFASFVFPASIGAWYFRKGGSHSILVTNTRLKCHSGGVNYDIPVEIIISIGVSRIWSADQNYEEYFLVTNQNVQLPVPRIHELSPRTVVKALLKANEKIDTSEIKDIL